MKIRQLKFSRKWDSAASLQSKSHACDVPRVLVSVEKNLSDKGPEDLRNYDFLFPRVFAAGSGG